MPLLEPQQRAGWTYYGAGGQYVKSTPLPIQQEEDFSAEGLLNQQYQQQLNQIEQEVKIAQQTATSNARYQMDTLKQKYQIERREIENMRGPIDKKREKLLALNTKYELAATTIRGKIQPDLDGLQTQRQQAIQQIQTGLQNKLQELAIIDKLGQEWSLSPEAVQQKKLQAIGYNFPLSAFKQADPQQRLMELTISIAALEEQAETATGEIRKNVLSQIETLHQERREVMSRLIPDFSAPIKSASKLTEATAAAGAGRKPGTLNEGMLREKQKALKIDTTQFRGFAPIFKGEVIPKKKEKTIEPKYQQNKKTGETRVSYDGGKTWQVIG